jgi:ATP-dependent DNA ligase
MTQIRPMLAAQKYRTAGDLWGPLHEKVVLEHLRQDGFLYGQPKWDGMRACLYEGVARSRSWKPLANQALQRFVADHPHLQGLDGEVFTGHDYAPESFRASMSGIRSGDGSGDITFVYFDLFTGTELSYQNRLDIATQRIGNTVQRFEGKGYSVLVMQCPTVELRTLEEIYTYEAKCLADGFEGAIVRRPVMGYKYGRSTALGGTLVKVKRRDYVDAQVIGYEQRYENQNEAKENELGLTSRSAHQKGLVPLDMLGALQIRILNGPLKGVEQKCGVFRGLSHTDLRDLWQVRNTIVGRYCEVSVDKATGGYDAARCPVWIRWRDASEF